MRRRALLPPPVLPSPSLAIGVGVGVGKSAVPRTASVRVAPCPQAGFAPLELASSFAVGVGSRQSRATTASEVTTVRSLPSLLLRRRYASALVELSCATGVGSKSGDDKDPLSLVAGTNAGCGEYPVRSHVPELGKSVHDGGKPGSKPRRVLKDHPSRSHSSHSNQYVFPEEPLIGFS
jgi:hypothetical protein